jgi:hypothetical protein
MTSMWLREQIVILRLCILNCCAEASKITAERWSHKETLWTEISLTSAVSEILWYLKNKYDYDA